MKAPFPVLALIAFMLLLLAATLEPFGFRFLPHLNPGWVLLGYIIGGVIGTLLADYMPHYSSRTRAARHGSLRDWFPR